MSGQTQQEQVSILLNGNGAMVETRNGSSSSRKRVATNDLVAALAGALKFDTGMLPTGARFYAGSRSDYRIGIEVPGIVRDAVFSLPNRGGLEKRIPFPSVLFVFHVSERRVKETRLYAFVPPLGAPWQRLCLFPLGNVNFEGTVCWGSVPLAQIEIAAPQMLDSVVNRFFSSTFSGHYVGGTAAFVPPEGVVDLESLISHLEGKVRFPDAALRQSNIYLKDIVNDQTNA